MTIINIITSDIMSADTAKSREGTVLERETPNLRSRGWGGVPEKPPTAIASNPKPHRLTMEEKMLRENERRVTRDSRRKT